ncbi:MFS transporter [Paractinoplanes rhizophilus]|uniref:MFS transporter n=1 Tax=Paractinoplanes rhizophilus TaxID=1416877 RepID=A0ABW2I1I8_9ACTN
MRQPGKAPVALAYVAFVLVGVNAGVNGVLLAAQIDDYAVSRSTLGLTFFASSAGFVLAGVTAGALIHRFGIRIAMATGGVAYVLTALYAGTRPAFAAFVVLQIASGYAVGVLESVLNAYLSGLPNATTLLNRLHGFFGVGALLGPPLAAWIVALSSWPTVMLVLAAVAVPLTAGFLIVFPRTDPSPAAAQPESAAARGLARLAARQAGVLLGAALLAVYVGLELGVGNWAFGYLVDGRGQAEVLAGYAVSGYWLGLTAGRFLLSPIVTRLGFTAAGLMTICIAGVTVVTALTWALPGTAAATAGLVLLGFFLGPIFPTAMALAPRLSTARLVPSSIGLMNAGSVVGGSLFPWLAGAIAEGAGVWTLLPFTLALSLLQHAIWWPMARRLGPLPESPSPATTGSAARP